MCEPTRRFLLCTCVPGTPPASGRIAFRLARFVEQLETEQEGLLATAAEALPEEGLTATDVEAQLASGDCFDFPYVPAEGDRLTLRQVGTGSPFLSFRFRDGRFRAAGPAGFGEVLATQQEGLLAFVDRRPRNALRAELVRALDGHDGTLRAAAAELLRLVDTATDAELAADDHALLELGYASARPIGADRSTLDAYDALVASLRHAAEDHTRRPSVPARTPLPPHEAAACLAGLVARIARAPHTKTAAGRAPERTRAAAIAAFRARLGPGEVVLLRLRPAEGYAERLSSRWLTDESDERGTVWADAAMDSVLVFDADDAPPRWA